jgi:MoxR-like ATPase
VHDTSQTHPLQVPRRLQQPVQLGAAQAEQFAATFEALASAVDTVVLGKQEVVRLALTAMFA